MACCWVEISRWLIESLITNRMLQIEFPIWINQILPNYQRYFKNLGVHYDTESIVIPPINQGFKSWTSKILENKMSILDKGDGRTVESQPSPPYQKLEMFTKAQSSLSTWHNSCATCRAQRNCLTYQQSPPSNTTGRLDPVTIDSDTNCRT